LEWLAGTSWARQTLPYRSTGNYHYQFEIKWYHLQQYVQQNDGVDVILMGSSLVNTGLDPEVISQETLSQSGQELRIFNFGVEGLTIAPQAAIARILLQQYQPAVLVYVTEMREYMGGVGVKDEQRFLASPWVQYRQGNFNPLGWLVDRSQALQTLLTYRNWMRTDFPDSLQLYLARNKTTTTGGYEPENAVGKNLDVPPDPTDPAEAKTFSTFGNYQIDSARLEDLKGLLSLGKASGIEILLVEMPVHPTFYDYAGGEQVHRDFQAVIAAETGSSGMVFIPAETCPDIPLEGRANRWHLNRTGAPFFSRCLASSLVRHWQDLGLTLLP
jgi:hypothetical protein